MQLLADMTSAEIGRSLERVEHAIETHGGKLDSIIVQTTKTNGRVDQHQHQINALESNISWAWRGILALNVTVVAEFVFWWVTRP